MPGSDERNDSAFASSAFRVILGSATDLPKPIELDRGSKKTRYEFDGMAGKTIGRIKTVVIG